VDQNGCHMQLMVVKMVKYPVIYFDSALCYTQPSITEILLHANEPKRSSMQHTTTSNKNISGLSRPLTTQKQTENILLQCKQHILCLHASSEAHSVKKVMKTSLKQEHNRTLAFHQ